MAVNLKGLRKEISWMSDNSVLQAIGTFRKNCAEGRGNTEDQQIMLRELEAEAVKRGIRAD